MVPHHHPDFRLHTVVYFLVDIYSETSISCGQDTVSDAKDLHGNEKYTATAFKKAYFGDSTSGIL